MTPNTTAASVADVLEQRAELLESLKEGPKDKRTLTAETGVSRSTVDRGIRELETLDLVEYTDGQYEPNLCSELAIDEYHRFMDTIETICRLQPFFRWLPSEAFDADVRWLSEATLYTPQPGDPYAMLNRHIRRLRNMDTVHSLLPYTGQHATEAATEAIVEHGAMGTILVESHVAETFQDKPAYATRIDEAAATGRLQVFEYDGSFPYAVSVFDDSTVQLLADEDGEPRALVEADNADLYEWASQTIDSYKQQATQII